MMRILFLSVIIIMICIFLPFGKLLAMDHPTFNEHQEQCYATAMLGYDSVINVRLGLLPEHALALSKQANTSNVNSSQYDPNVLNVMLAAYLWKESPHSYALSVFYDCARNDSYQRQTMAE